MKEKIYTIPVNDAFSSDCECPICSMFEKLENDAVEYAMGPSYMEDDIREKTDKIGFCSRHIKKIYEQNNRLGLPGLSNAHETKQHDAENKRRTRSIVPTKLGHEPNLLHEST